MNRSVASLLRVLAASLACLSASARAQEPASAAARAPLPEPVLCGVDVLVRDAGKQLAGRTVGLITNHTGLARDGRRTIDVLAALPGVKLAAIFSPEHGLQGTLDRDGIAHGKDEATGLPVWSLYGDTRVPTAEMLQGMDTLVFDIQDIGCRFYTYVSTMGNCLQAAAEHKLRFCVLDRPNPIGGALGGPLLDAGQEAFVGWHTIPVRHGLTAGELMRMFVGERGMKVQADVVPCEQWSRTMTFDQTGLLWTNPSPNMRSLTEALLYPGIGLIEGTNVSVGRGTDRPFEIVGAPWCDGVALAARLRADALPGVAFVPIRFTPTASKHKGKECSGVDIAITDRAAFEPIATGIALACALRDLCKDWQPEKVQWLLRNQKAFDALLAGKDWRAIAQGWQQDLTVFRMRSKPFLLYQ